MTVRDILNRALDLLFESASSAPDYVERAASILDTMVPELFEVNNELRVSKGLASLQEWPSFTGLEDLIPFEPELCRAAIPYGLAANLLLADEEEGRAGNYFNKYADAVNSCMRLKPQSVVDVYADREAADI